MAASSSAHRWMMGNTVSDVSSVAWLVAHRETVAEHCPLGDINLLLLEVCP